MFDPNSPKDTIRGSYSTQEECQTEIDAGNQPPWFVCEAKGHKVGDPIFWRIVRVNGDGSIKLIYSGERIVQNGLSNESIIDMSACFDNSKIGYTYTYNGEQKSSSIKEKIDSWYNEHLKQNYNKYISDINFCNDKSLLNEEFFDDGSGMQYSIKTYNSFDRLKTKKIPSFICQNKEDRYTVNSKEGNNFLEVPIGLLTADEAYFAGAHENSSSNIHYLYSSNSFCTSTPLNFHGYLDNPEVWVLDSNLYIHSYDSEQYGVRPVINLKADVKFEGEGTIDSPYEIITE